MSEENYNNHNTELEESVNIVGTHKGKKAIIVGVLIVVLGLTYYFFFNNKKTNDPTSTSKSTQEIDIEKLLKDSVPPAQEVSPMVNIPPQLPELPPLVSPSLPSLPTIEKPKVLEVPKIIQKEKKIPTPSPTVEAKPEPKIPLPTQNKIEVIHLLHQQQQAMIKKEEQHPCLPCLVDKI